MLHFLLPSLFLLFLGLLGMQHLLASVKVLSFFCSQCFFSSVTNGFTCALLIPVILSIPGDLLENYCWDDDLINVSRLMFSGTILLTYPIECLVTREVIINTFFPRDKDVPDERAAWYRHVFITLAIVIVTYFLSMSTDCLGVVLELNVSVCYFSILLLFCM